MPEEKGKQLTFDDRCEIEEMLKAGESFRKIAGALGVSPTTISEEVRKNRTFFKPQSFTDKGQARCVNYSKCRVVMLCHACTSGAASCKRCPKKHCYDLCRDFEQSRCPTRERAPFVCVRCPKRGHCDSEKARYVASKAQAAHDERIRLAHLGISCEPHELRAMVDKVKGLLAQGQSLEAIWAVHGGEFPVCVRTFYNYMDKGVMGLANIELPKKVRYSPRKKRAEGTPKMDFAGRTYADWLALPEEMRLRTVQIDCVEGLRRNTKCILTLHFVRLFFQIHILLPAKTQANVKAAVDALEAYCEGAFSDAFPVMLADRGSEFLDFAKIETGADGSQRTRVFYCDPVKPGQKGACEKNHVELRKILPKGTDFDALTPWDVSVASSHVNSYVRAGQGAAPIALASLVLPGSLLENLGITAIPPDDVVMRPEAIGR